MTVIQGVQKVTVQHTAEKSGIFAAHDLPVLPLLRNHTASVARSYLLLT
jgi:hypothetical protein